MPTFHKQKDKVPVILPSLSLLPPPPQLKKRGYPLKTTKVVKVGDLEEEAKIDASLAKKPRVTSKGGHNKGQSQTSGCFKNHCDQTQAAMARDKLPSRDGQNEHPGLHPGAGSAPRYSHDEIQTECEAVKEAAENKVRCEATVKHNFALIRKTTKL